MKDRYQKLAQRFGAVGTGAAVSLLLALLVTALLWGTGIVKPITGISMVGAEPQYERTIRRVKQGVTVEQTFQSPTDNLGAVAVWVCGNEYARPGTMQAELWDAAEDTCLQIWTVDTTPFVFSASRMFLQLDHPVVDAERRQFRLIITSQAEEADALTLWKTDAPMPGGILKINGLRTTGNLTVHCFKADSTSINVLYLFAFCACVFALVFFGVPAIQKRRRAHGTRLSACANGQHRARTAVIGEIVLLVSAAAWSAVGQIETLDIAHMRMPVMAFWLLTFSLVWWTAVYWKDMERRPETIYLFAVLSCSLAYLFATPFAIPVSWDEAIHFDRTVSVAHFLSGKTSLANQWVRMGPVMAGNYFDPHAISRRQSVLEYLYASGATAVVRPDYLRALNAVCYVPAALFLRLGQLLPLSFTRSYAFGELGNVLLYAGLTYFAVRKVRSGKMIVATASLVVTSVFQAVHYTYDSWLTAFFIFGFACFISAMQEDCRLTLWEQICMVGAFVLGNCAKACYFPLMAVLLWIPKEKFADERQCTRFRASVLAGMAALACTIVLGMKLPQTVVHLAAGMFVLYWPIYWIWCWLSKRSTAARFAVIAIFVTIVVAGGTALLYRVVPTIMNVGDARGGDVNAPAQLINILRHPLRCGRIMVDYLVNTLFSFSSPRGWDMNFYNIENLPERMTWRFFPPLLLAITALTDKSEADLWPRRGWVRWSTIALGLVTCLMITMILYVDFTPYGLNEVRGVQARYLLPLFYPFLAVIGSGRIRNEIRPTAYNTACLSAAVFILLFGIWETAISCYSWLM